MTNTPKLIRSFVFGLVLLFGHMLNAQIDSAEIELNIFPNPNQGTFYITTIADESYQSQLFSMEGKLVKNIRLQSGLNYVSVNIPAGVYLLRVRREEYVQDFKVVIR